jgi:hypothetical protein
MPSSDALFDAAFTRLSDPELSQPPSSYLRAAGKMAKDFGQSVLDAVRLPGQVAGGEFAVKPETPGMWSEEDEYRQQRAGNVIESRAKDLAGFVTGGGYSAPAQRNATGMGIRAYHGSPHDFDRFDLSKIGTGEGAQAYGHGLYFAEKEGVAQSYRDALTNRAVPQGPHIEKVAFNVVSRAPQMADAELAPFIRNVYPNASDDEVLKSIQVARSKVQPGRMYEVDINARPEQFLDWDKPLAAHAPEIQKAVQSIDSPMYRAWEQSGAFPHVKGETLYRELAGGLTNRAHAEGKHVGATDALRSAGIPGIKYLDQGSRGAGEGSRNYVVFDDKLVNILRKYGIAGGAVTGAATMGGNQAEAKDDFGAQLESELQAIMPSSDEEFDTKFSLIEKAFMGGLRAIESAGFGGAPLKLYNDVVQRGRTAPITREDIQPHDAANLLDIVNRKIAATGQASGSIDYRDYGNSPVSQNLLGGFRYDASGDKVRISDTYDFNRNRDDGWGENRLAQALSALANPRGLAASIGRKIAPDGRGVPVIIDLDK